MSGQPNHSLRDMLNNWIALQRRTNTEPEIDEKQQSVLIACLRTAPHDDPNFFPFLHWKLTRADVEWLLAHPLVDIDKLEESVEEMRENSGTLLGQKAATNFRRELYEILDNRQRVDLRGADLSGVNLSGLHLAEARLEYADLMSADLRGAFLQGAHLEHAYLIDTHLEKTTLTRAHLQGANLKNAHLEGASLGDAHLEGTNLTRAHFEGAILKGAFFDSATILEGIFLSNTKYGSTMLDNAHWGDADLSVVDWAQMKVIGDEQWARQLKRKHKDELKPIHEKKKEYKQSYKRRNIRQYQLAARANRRLAVVLQEQGLNEDAARFAYNAQVLQRTALRWEHKYGQWLFSVFLAALTGYGYRMWRILIVYGCIVSLCAVAYYILGLYYPPHLSLLLAFLESITAFHGRVFSELFNSYTPQVWVTAFEAIAGLIIEGVFIAMLTQRFFGK